MARINADTNHAGFPSFEGVSDETIAEHAARVLFKGSGIVPYTDTFPHDTLLMKSALKTINKISEDGLAPPDGFYASSGRENQAALAEFFRRVIPGLNEQLGLGFEIKTQESKE